MSQDASASRSSRSRLPGQIIGAKYVRLLQKHLAGLRGTDEHGNRCLFLDDVFIVHLLAFFNPTVRSLRTIEDLSRGPAAQKHISVQAVCRSTLSDFHRLIDPQRLQPMLTALRGECHRKGMNLPAEHNDLNTLLNRTIAVDGTFLPAMADVAWAVCHSNNHGARRHRARLDAHVNVATWIPETIVIPEAGRSEADSAAGQIRPGAIHLYDRGFMSFDLLAAHARQSAPGTKEQPAGPGSHFVVRYRPAGGNSPELTHATDNGLTDEDRAAGVISDRTGCFTSAAARRAGIGQLPVREVVVQFECDGRPTTLRLITSLTDLPARVIALLYRYRWQVELFFRWLKCQANFSHLISHSPRGVLAHLYVAIIGVMLIWLHGGYRPNKYVMALLTQVAFDGATLEDILPILRRRQREIELARIAAAKRRARKKQQPSDG